MLSSSIFMAQGPEIFCHNM